MEIQKSTGIVLSSRSYGEADVLCSILTREFGKRKFSFKGLKKSRRRSKSASDHGTRLKLVYYYHENRDIHIVNEFHIDNDCAELRDNLNKIFHLCYLLEVTDKTTAFDEKNNYSYELLSAAIETLKKTDFLINLSLFYTIHLLRFNGILPDIGTCSQCSSKIITGFALGVSDLNPVCGECYGGGERLLEINSKRFFDISLRSKFAEIDHKQFDEKMTVDLLFILILFIEDYFNAPIKSKSFILSEEIHNSAGI